MSRPAPYWASDERVTLYHDDCRAVMAGMEAESVSCVVTSPPFWGLRKYDCPPSIWGGDPECAHEWGTKAVEGEGYTSRKRWQHSTNAEFRDGPAVSKRTEHPEAWTKTIADTATCSLCGAWRGWYGLEPTVAMYVEHTVEVLRAIRRVLRKDGVVWWDLDDSRGSSGTPETGSGLKGGPRKGLDLPRENRRAPDKSLCLIPQRVAIAAQEDGWIVRSEIIIPTWMPESAQDRPTDACRKLLMLCKSKRYWYDGFAVRVPQSGSSIERWAGRDGEGVDAPGYIEQRDRLGVLTDGENRHLNTDGLRNLGSVWDDLPPSSYPAAHFATFPVAEPERCLKASCPPDGLCLDPFIGTGTTAVAAVRLGRRCIGIDLSEEYLKQAVTRLTVGDKGVRQMVAARRDGAEQGVLL